jgi:hypothetical protein
MVKKEREKLIFEAFIKIEPNFAGEQVFCEQCSKDPPDIICVNNKNRRIGVELVEWLHEDQTTRSRAFEDLEKRIRQEAFPDNVKDYLKNHDVSIFPVSDKFPRKSDRSRFISELIDILNQFILRQEEWEEENWLNDFRSHPKLEEFITTISIYRTRLPLGIEFVRGGDYSPKAAMDALFERLNNKINHENYKNLKSKLRLNDFHLIVYYSMAMIYNSPFTGIEQDIHSIVEYARKKLLKNQGPFDKIFLFYALEPSMAVYPLWP